jgi:hypothetical protein
VLAPAFLSSSDSNHGAQTTALAPTAWALMVTSVIIGPNALFLLRKKNKIVEKHDGWGKSGDSGPQLSVLSFGKLKTLPT